MITGKDSYKMLLLLLEAVLNIFILFTVLSINTAYSWVVGSIFGIIQAYNLYKRYKTLKDTL